MSTFEESRIAELSARAAALALLLATTKDIASTLGEGWSVEEESDIDIRDNGYIKLHHTDGRGIGIHASSYNFKGKIEISGIYNFGDPSLKINFPYKAERPDISVSLSRGGAAIAKDILRRFMPIYDLRFAEISASVKAYSDNRDRKQGISDRLGALAGAKDSRLSHEGFTTYRDGGAYVDAKIYDTVELTIHDCSEDLAARIIALVNDSRTPLTRQGADGMPEAIDFTAQYGGAK